MNIIGNLNKMNSLTVFVLFTSCVGIGFAYIDMTQYVVLSIILGALVSMFNTEYLRNSGLNEIEMEFAQQLNLVSEALLYGLLPSSLLLTISKGSVLSLLVMALYMLATAIRLAHVHRPLHFQGDVKVGYTQGLSVESIGLIIPIAMLLGYLLPLSIYQYFHIIVMLGLAFGFIIDYPIPSLPQRYRIPITILLVGLSFIFLWFGSII